MQYNPGEQPQGSESTAYAEDNSRRTAAIIAIAGTLSIVLLLCALCISFCRSDEPVSGTDAVSDAVLSEADAVSDSDYVSFADIVGSSADVVSDSDVIYYPEVHIDGIVLPEEYGDGLFDEQAAMWLINEYRRQNGVHELLTDPYQLTLVTRLRLEECLEHFSHDRPDGSRFFTAYSQVGLFYYHCAENLAYGQYSAEQVVQDWINSPSHRDNLLSPMISYMCVRMTLGEDGIPRWVFEAYSSPR